MRASIARLAALAGAFAVLAALSGPALAADADGETLYKKKTCVACHGKGGVKAILDYPNLAGQNEAYLVDQMQDIKSGKREGGPDQTGNPRTKGMQGVMHLVKPDEMKAIAAWLADQPPAPPAAAKTPVDPAVAEEGATLYKRYNCKNCHGDDGNKPLNQKYPYLSGQKQAYLVNQMTDMREGVRKNGLSGQMRGFIKRASDEDIQKIAAYLSTIERKQ